MKRLALITNTAVVAAVLVFVFQSCKTKKTSKNDETLYAREPAVVYKTKKDYSTYVPVTLNSTKTEIVAYPSPKDVFYKGKLAYPVKLENSYWLDNRGIGVNSAFLNITYDAYSKLETAPPLSELFSSIIDSDPFVEIYNIGNRDRFTDETKEINKLIKAGKLSEFKKIK
ncbi:MAG: hypothetical protein KIS94_03270 [Chitinophagales bacterium]|nr:hypothetical protein [Chitinophagales bacterium]